MCGGCGVIFGIFGFWDRWAWGAMQVLAGISRVFRYVWAQSPGRGVEKCSGVSWGVLSFGL